MDTAADRSRQDLTATVRMQSSALTIVIPVYNEGANFCALWSEFESAVRIPFQALVVYDFDADDTLPAVRALMAGGETRLRLLKNRFGRGVVGALRTGFAAVTRGPVLVVMADCSDDLRHVEPMLVRYRQGYHLIAASRYAPGGGVQGGPWLKRHLSRWAGRSLHRLRGLPTSDATNAFKIYDAAMLHSLDLRSGGGFDLILEITVKAFLQGYRITELPTTWRDRTQGTSQFRLWAWLPHYLRWYAYAFQPRRSKTHNHADMMNPLEASPVKCIGVDARPATDTNGREAAPGQRLNA